MTQESKRRSTFMLRLRVPGSESRHARGRPEKKVLGKGSAQVLPDALLLTSSREGGLAKSQSSLPHSSPGLEPRTSGWGSALGFKAAHILPVGDVVDLVHGQRVPAALGRHFHARHDLAVEAGAGQQVQVCLPGSYKHTVSWR